MPLLERSCCEQPAEGRDESNSLGLRLDRTGGSHAAKGNSRTDQFRREQRNCSLHNEVGFASSFLKLFHFYSRGALHLAKGLGIMNCTIRDR